MQKEKPILFSTPMVQAILNGTKTETRRVMKPQPSVYNGNTVNVDSWGNYTSDIEDDYKTYKCPYGQPGDVLYVREQFTYLKDAKEPEQITTIYKADAHKVIHPDDIQLLKWKPSIHMPKAAARIWLQVEEIKVEQLQDITEESAIAEGIQVVKNGLIGESYGDPDGGILYGNPCNAFMSLWSRINGYDSWDANPWVWVVKFKVLSTTGEPTLKQIWQALGRPRNLGYQPDTGEYHFANKIIKP